MATLEAPGCPNFFKHCEMSSPMLPLKRPPAAMCPQPLQLPGPQAFAMPPLKPPVCPGSLLCSVTPRPAAGTPSYCCKATASTAAWAQSALRLNAPVCSGYSVTTCFKVQGHAQSRCCGAPPIVNCHKSRLESCKACLYTPALHQGRRKPAVCPVFLIPSKNMWPCVLTTVVLDTSALQATERAGSRRG